jgi:hypothetical protein
MMMLAGDGGGGEECCFFAAAEIEVYQLSSPPSSFSASDRI